MTNTVMLIELYILLECVTYVTASVDGYQITQDNIFRNINIVI